MISNGYLFDAEIVRRARELWHLWLIQITLDGTEEIYNKVKAFVYPEGSAFRRVMRNIRYLPDEQITVHVRMNLDRHNDAAITEALLDAKLITLVDSYTAQ